MREFAKKLISNMKIRLENADRWSGGRLGIMGRAVKGFSNQRGTQAAAGIAYYTFFSLFPLLLLLIVAGSYFLTDRHAFQMAINLVTGVLPVSRKLIEANLQQVIKARGTVSLLGALGLLWSASNVFAALADNINLAWPGATDQGFLRERLAGFAMIGVLILLLLLSLAANAFMGLLKSFQAPVSLNLNDVWHLLSSLTSWLLIFILLLVLYRWIPARRVSWSVAGWSALFVTILWKTAAGGFVWYLNSGLKDYRLVYGSLGAVVALIFLVYIISTAILFGAHFSAAIQGLHEDKQNLRKAHTGGK